MSGVQPSRALQFSAAGGSHSQHGAAWQSRYICKANAPMFSSRGSGTQRGIPQLQDGESLSLSNFDVGVENKLQNGFKGLIYGDVAFGAPAIRCT